MTHDELVARYRLLAKSQSDGVESWEAVDAETDQEVNVHRLSTSRQISILDMMAHLDPAERARIVEQLVVDDVPVVVTKRLPPSTTFIQWLQNSVPSTVTSVIRPLTRPREQHAPSAPAAKPPAQVPESLTAMFLASEVQAHGGQAPQPKTTPPAREIERIDSPPDSSAPPPISPEKKVDPPTVEKEERRTTPVTPLAELAGGLTEIFSASELLEKIGPEATIKRGAVAPPRSAPSPAVAPVTSAVGIRPAYERALL